MRKRSAALTGLVAALLLIPAASASAADPTGDFDFSPNVPLVGDSVTFTPKDLADPEILPVLSGIQSVKFDFGDGSEVTDSAAPFDAKTHAYANPGTRTVVMTITDIANDTTTVDHNVRVNSRPIARFSFSPDTPNVGARVTLDAGTSTDNLAIPNAGFDWDLDGDGQYDDATGRTTSVIFRTPGDKTVRLRVTDSDGVTDSTSHAIHVNLPPVAAFVWSPTAPVIGQKVEFTSVSRDPDGPVRAEAWDLDGDSQYDDAQAPDRLDHLQGGRDQDRPPSCYRRAGPNGQQAVSFFVAKKIHPPLSPCPIIRVLGLAYVRHVRIDLFSVKTFPAPP